MNDQERLIRFEGEMLLLMNDAYNLARWLVQNDEDARDMVQEAPKSTSTMSRTIKKSGPATFPIPNARIFITVLKRLAHKLFPITVRILRHNKPGLEVCIKARRLQECSCC